MFTRSGKLLQYELTKRGKQDNMSKRFVTIWFCNLVPEWMAIRRRDLQNVAFAFASPDHGMMIITSASHPAQLKGIYTGMVVADARAIVPSLQVFDEQPE